MSESPKEASKFSRFFEEKGFYIILFLCVAAIGIAGYVLFLDPANKADDSAQYDSLESGDPSTSAGGEILRPMEPVDPAIKDNAADVETNGSVDPGMEADVPTDTGVANADVSSVDGELSEPAINGDAVIRDAVETIANGREEETPAASTQDSKKAETVPTFFVRPVSGDIQKEFSGDELVYDRTMGDWRTHNGADFTASEGALVAVIADGVIQDIYRDEYFGTGILVEHSGGLCSVYLGLIENATVTVGQEVKAGDTIGAISTKVLFESLEPAHLHLEMTLNGTRVDPMEYLPG